MPLGPWSSDEGHHRVDGCRSRGDRLRWIEASDVVVLESASLSPDRASIGIAAYGIPDRDCWEHDCVETKVSGDDLIVSLFYLRPEAGQFCNIPRSCPAFTSQHCFGFDDQKRGASSHVIESAAEESVDCSVGFVESWPFDLTLKNQDLVAHCEDFSVA